MEVKSGRDCKLRMCRRKSPVVDGGGVAVRGAVGNVLLAWAPEHDQQDMCGVMRRGKP